MWKLVALCLISPSAWAEPPASTPAEQSPVSVVFFGDRGPSIRIHAREGAVALPSCRGLVWERFNLDSGEFELLQQPPCGAMAPALWVDEQGLELTAPEELGLSAGDRVRVTVVVGLGGTQGMPFEVSACERIEQHFGALGEVK